jgi:hypothetical protein
MGMTADFWALASDAAERFRLADKETQFPYLRGMLDTFEMLAFTRASRSGFGLEVAAFLVMRKLGLKWVSQVPIAAVFEGPGIEEAQGPSRLFVDAIDDLDVYLRIIDGCLARLEPLGRGTWQAWAAQHGVGEDALIQVFRKLFGSMPDHDGRYANGILNFPKGENLDRCLRQVRLDRLDKVRFLIAACIPNAIYRRDGTCFENVSTGDRARWMSRTTIDPPAREIFAAQVSAGGVLHGTVDADDTWFNGTVVPLPSDVLSLVLKLPDAERHPAAPALLSVAWREEARRTRTYAPTPESELRAKALLSARWSGIAQEELGKLPPGTRIQAIVVDYVQLPGSNAKTLMNVCLVGYEHAGTTGVPVGGPLQGGDIRRGARCEVHIDKWVQERSGMKPYLSFRSWL